MSEDNNSIVDDAQNANGSNQEQTDVVKREAYEDVSKDMHKYKSQSKELKAALNEYEVKLKNLEEEKMREQNQWKELADKYKSENEQILQENAEKERRILDTVKRNALKNELGSVKDEYLIHANINNISLNEDGTINSESLHGVANDFREKHSSLIPSNASNPTGMAPASTTESKVITRDDLSKLSQAEKIALLKLKQNS